MERDAGAAVINRRWEFDEACREYGVECGSTMKLAHLAPNSDDMAGASIAKAKATARVREAWQAMVAAGDPETRQVPPGKMRIVDRGGYQEVDPPYKNDI